MRTTILSAAIFGLFAAGCAGELSGTGDDQQPPEGCGDGVVGTGETCDDGNTTSGDGCSSACTTEESTTPKLNVTVDKPTVNTELNTDTMITVTLTGEGGFGESVNLTGSVVDATNNPLTGWTVTFDQASVTVPQNGTATAVATVHVPSENNGLIGTVKIDAASTLGTASASSQFTALNQITLNVTNNGTQCVYPTTSTTTVKVGTTLRFVNKFNAGVTAGDRITIHINPTNGGGTGVPHEADPGHVIDSAYERVTTGAGTINWYCHAPGPTVNGLTFDVVP